MLQKSTEGVFSLINSLQLCTLTVLFNLKIPSNVKSILVTTLKLVNLDVLQTEPSYRYIFGFTDTEPFNQLFDSAGFDSSNFVIGIGPIFAVGVIFPILRFLKLTTRRTLLKYCSVKLLQYMYGVGSPMRTNNVLSSIHGAQHTQGMSTPRRKL